MAGLEKERRRGEIFSHIYYETKKGRESGDGPAGRPQNKLSKHPASIITEIREEPLLIRPS